MNFSEWIYNEIAQPDAASLMASLTNLLGNPTSVDFAGRWAFAVGDRILYLQPQEPDLVKVDFDWSAGSQPTQTSTKDNNQGTDPFSGKKLSMASGKTLNASIFSFSKIMEKVIHLIKQAGFKVIAKAADEKREHGYEYFLTSLGLKKVSPNVYEST